MTPTGGGNVNPLADLADLADFMPTADSSSIEAVENITSVDGAIISASDVYEAENLNFVSEINCALIGCAVVLPGASNAATLLKNNLADISLIANNAYFSPSSYSSKITNGITIEGTTFARGNLTGTRMADSSPLEFETFTGWLDGSIFGITQIKIGASDGNEQYRFFSYNAGVYDASNATNPTAAGSETDSATWEGATVASIKASREFILGDATITGHPQKLSDKFVILGNSNFREVFSNGFITSV